MYATKNQKLIGIYRRVEDCSFCRREKNTLQHILGVGDTQKPKFALVLINPTHRNISSQPDWPLYRFPFIGVRHFWKVFQRAGIFSLALLNKIYKDDWSKGLLEEIIDELSERKIYLTNLVKCTGDGPEYPSNERIALGKSLLVEELKILKPKNAICFGLLPFRQLTGHSVKLVNCYEQLKRGYVESSAPSTDLGFSTRILPCYFPAGRGNPARASEMLRYYLEHL